MSVFHYLSSHNLRSKKALALAWDFAPMSMNTQVQAELNRRGTSEKVDDNLKVIETQKTLEGTK